MPRVIDQLAETIDWIEETTGRTPRSLSIPRADFETLYQELCAREYLPVGTLFDRRWSLLVCGVPIQVSDE